MTSIETLANRDPSEILPSGYSVGEWLKVLADVERRAKFGAFSAA